ncbi:MULTISPECIES: hypothetical protein [Halorussus]|uniref:hypothetical protein n=1 Tax=Halorussus TaxID=1070314 RepID=UPI0014053612|nr:MULTISPECIES: hypothetical protein [Halorussus]NHN61521.1 hypothetical protein [Halorussus sp. JP-T4]
MAARSEANRDETLDEDREAESPALSLLETRPGRRVLTEEGNTDGWIATDVTVDVLE